jgi:L-galactose dehydrogenase
LREAVASLVARGQVEADAVDADDPLGFLRPYSVSGALTEIAYRFCRHEPGAQVILTGTGDVAHLEANVAAIQGPPLPPEALERLQRLFGAVDSLSGN